MGLLTRSVYFLKSLLIILEKEKEKLRGLEVY